MLLQCITGMPWIKVFWYYKSATFACIQVGIPEMFENHQRLKQSRTEAKSLEMNFNSIKERLENLRQRNARLEQDVKNFEEREKHLDNIRILQMKRPWLVRWCWIFVKWKFMVMYAQLDWFEQKCSLYAVFRIQLKNQTSF